MSRINASEDIQKMRNGEDSLTLTRRSNNMDYSSSRCSTERHVHIAGSNRTADRNSYLSLLRQQNSRAAKGSGDGSSSNDGFRTLTCPKPRETKTIDRLCLTTDQYQKLHKKERALASVGMQSHFSQLLRQAVKPCKQDDRTNEKTKGRQRFSSRTTRSSLPSAMLSYRAEPRTSLRMSNEGSSFSQYVRLNKSAHHRMANKTW